MGDKTEESEESEFLFPVLGCTGVCGCVCGGRKSIVVCYIPQME